MLNSLSMVLSKIKFKDENGVLVTDPEMMKLAPQFFKSVKSKTAELLKSHGDMIFDTKYEKADEVEFEIISKELEQLMQCKFDVINASDGEKNEFYHDFSRGICSQTLLTTNQ